VVESRVIGGLVFSFAADRAFDERRRALKLAIARQALRALPPDAAYVDVSVPGRPVAGPAAVADPNSQVSGGG
jgi:hypothetical protein